MFYNDSLCQLESAGRVMRTTANENTGFGIRYLTSGSLDLPQQVCWLDQVYEQPQLLRRGARYLWLHGHTGFRVRSVANWGREQVFRP